MEKLEKRVFMICPVRDLPEELDNYLQGYISGLEDKGHKVHYPPRDTNQKDPIGLNICNENKEAITNADEVRIYYDAESKGSMFDLGMTLMAEKPLYIVNGSDMIDDLRDDFSKFLFTYAYNTELTLYVPLCETLSKRKEKIEQAKVIKYKWRDDILDDKINFLFDFGMAFMAEKPIALTNRSKVKKTPHKSFQNVLLALDKKYRKK